MTQQSGLKHNQHNFPKAKVTKTSDIIFSSSTFHVVSNGMINFDLNVSVKQNNNQSKA